MQRAYIAEILNAPVTQLIKVSICLQFISIFTPERNAKFWSILSYILVNMVYYTIAMFVTMFQCDPPAKLWNPFLPGYCLRYQNWILASGVVNMVSDLLMLLFPIICIWNLHMSRKQKWGVSAIFLVGTL